MSNTNKTVLMVDDEEPFLLSAKEGIEVYSDQLNILTACNGSQAVQILNSEAVDLVVTDLKMPEMDGFQLIAHMSQRHRDVPVLVMTAFGTPEIQRRVKQLGALHYMEKPIGINELLDKIIDALSEKSRSCIYGFSLANFLQLVEIEEKTLSIRARSGDRIGYLYIDAGVLVDAETEQLTGTDAAIEIINWDKTEIEILDGICRKKGSINASLMQILLEASKSIDEKNFRRDGEDDPLEKAVRLAEGHHFREAQLILAGFLRDQPRNHLGWLWYSRVTGSMKHIDNALVNAMKIAPEDLLVIEEIKKFKIARRKLSEGQYPRCPYCWTPVEEKAPRCYYCRGYFYVNGNPRPVSDDDEVKQVVFIEAVSRYSKVIEREDNIRARFYLAMAHFNLNNWEEALDQIDRVVKLAPDRRFYAEQLRRFLDYMAASKTESQAHTTAADQLVDEWASPEAAKGKKKVVVVEDSATTRKVISITLNQRGYDVIEARDGIEAVSIISEEKPDLILLDIILPKMDGYRVLDIVREDPNLKKIPVIMLTSRDGLFNKVKGKMAGSAAYLTKPFEPQHLVKTVEKVLR
jgi:twitching motility two-component system response regulator PilG